MANREVGIKITAKDLTGKAFGSIGVAAGKATKAINGIPSAAGRAMKAFAFMSTGVNQAFELWAKVRERIISTVRDATDASLRFREATDPMRKWWEGQLKGIDMVKARMGDVLLPVLKGLSDAYKQVSSGAAEWLKANRRLVAGRILDWMTSFVRLGANAVEVIGGMAKAAAVVKAAFDGLVGVINTVVWTMLDGVGQLLVKMGELASMVGADGVGGSLVEAGSAAKEWGSVFASSATDSFESMMQVGDTIDSITAGTEAASKAMNTFADAASQAGSVAIMKDTGAGGTTTDEERAKTKESATKRAEIIMALEAKITDYKAQQLAYRRDMEIKASNESIMMAEQQAAAFADTFASVTVSMGNTFGAMIEQSGNADKAMKVMFKSMISQGIAAAQRMIGIYAAEAAALAFKGQLGVPIIGVALGTAAAATAFGMVGAWANKMALGGEVTGGVPGRDSVPALLMPGERVLSRSENERQKRGGGAPVQQTITIAPVVQSQLPPSNEQRRAIIADLAPMIEEAVRDGQLRLGGA